MSYTTLSRKLWNAARLGLAAAALLGLAVIPSQPAHAQTDGSANYTFTTFSIDGSSATYALGINNLGQIAGGYLDTNGNYVGCLLSAQSLQGSFCQPTDYFSYGLGSPGGIFFGINDWGQVTGGYYDSMYNIHDFEITQGDRIDFPYLQPNESDPVNASINDFGLISYTSVDAQGVTHGVVGFPGALTTVDNPNADVLGTEFYGNNNLGQIVGDYHIPPGPGLTVSRRQAFAYDAWTGQFTNLNVSAAHTDKSFLPYHLNDAGVIVGRYVDYDGISSGYYHGFLETPDQQRTGAYSVINVPGTLATIIYDINDFGDIVGFCFPPNGDAYGFLGRPKHP